MGSDERVVWQGAPSQVLNLVIFVGCALTCWLVIPLFVALYYWLKVRCHSYELTTERLRESQGILSRTTHELELYRVKDTVLIEPFYLRIFGLGNVELRTSDLTTPDMVLRAVRDGADVRNELRKHVEKMRERKRVAEIDFEGLSGR
jgi:uncharacterized membrane protein YdbT with pleckstrin-like domain